MYDVGECEKNVEMPVHFFLVEHFLLNQNPMNGRYYPGGHEHDQNVPVAFIQSLNTDNTSA